MTERTSGQRTSQGSELGPPECQLPKRDVALLMAETRLGPAQYLKVHPPESDLFELLLNVPPQKIVTRQIRAAFGRKHQCIRTCSRRDVAPIINLAGKIWRQRRLPLAA